MKLKFLIYSRKPTIFIMLIFENIYNDLTIIYYYILNIYNDITIIIFLSIIVIYLLFIYYSDFI